MSSNTLRVAAMLATAVLAGGALGLSGCGRGNGPHAGLDILAPGAPGAVSVQPDASSNTIAPEFHPENFEDGVANPLFPLDPLTRWTYETQTADGLETNTVDVTQDTKLIVGVTTTVIHDVVYLDGSLTEDTFDWYAPDRDGNVWYFGEDTKTYDHGVFVTSQGSWIAGEGGASPGVIMLAHPAKGDLYQQENSPGIVADRAKVVGLDETAVVSAGTFEHCLKTADSTPIEPGVRELKYYAQGVGVVLEVSHSGGGERVELTSFSKP